MLAHMSHQYLHALVFVSVMVQEWKEDDDYDEGDPKVRVGARCDGESYRFHLSGSSTSWPGSLHGHSSIYVVTSWPFEH
jgi:hypothetical protein